MLEILSAALIAALVVLFSGPAAIPLLHRLKFGQSIRAEGPASHQKKSGTPTMGGIFMIAGIVIATAIRAEWTTEIFLALFILLGHFLLGFLDDYIKVVKKRNLGLKARQKLLGQIIIAAVTIYFATTKLGIETTLWLPVVNDTIDLGAAYYVLVLLVIVGASNAVNLTDGLDVGLYGDSGGGVLRDLPADESHGAGDILRGDSWRVHRISAVQLPPRENIYGRHGFAGAGRSICRAGNFDAHGTFTAGRRAGIRLRSAVGYHTGNFVPDDGEKSFQNVADTSPLRAERLERAESSLRILDGRINFGRDWIVYADELLNI